MILNDIYFINKFRLNEFFMGPGQSVRCKYFYDYIFNSILFMTIEGGILA